MAPRLNIIRPVCRKAFSVLFLRAQRFSCRDSQSHRPHGFPLSLCLIPLHLTLTHPHQLRHHYLRHKQPQPFGCSCYPYFPYAPSFASNIVLGSYTSIECQTPFGT